MEKIRIEVVSEFEGRELCNNMGWTFDHVYLGKRQNIGKLMMVAYINTQDYSEPFDSLNPGLDVANTNPIKVEAKAEKNYAIYTMTSTGKLYWSRYNNGQRVSFQVADALRFDYKSALLKIKFMNKNGTHEWKIIKLKG